jgi:hypothetical protein
MCCPGCGKAINSAANADSTLESSHLIASPTTGNDTGTVFKVFIIAIIILGIIGMIAGVMAFLACKGILLGDIGDIGKLISIGEVNSYMMAAGGFILIILGTIAWCMRMKQDNQSLQGRNISSIHAELPESNK